MVSGDLYKDDDQFLVHEHGLCPHPHHGSQSEVVDESRHSHAASELISPVNASHKHQEHAQQCQAELDVELGGISISQFSGQVTEFHYKLSQQWLCISTKGVKWRKLT